MPAAAGYARRHVRRHPPPGRRRGRRPAGRGRLLPLVYDELRKLAAARLAAEAPARPSRPPPWSTRPTSGWSAATSARWNGRGHFFAAAAEAMRRILVESARRKGRLKHGGERQRVDLESGCLVSAAPSLDLLALDEALARLAETEPAKADSSSCGSSPG